MTFTKVKRGLAIVNLTVTLATLLTTGTVDKTNIFVGSSQVRTARRYVELANS